MSDANAQPAEPDAGGTESATTGRHRSLIVKILILAALVGVVTYVYVEHRDQLTLENIARHEAELNRFRNEHPVAIFVVAFLVYAAVTGLSLPGAAVLTLSYGWFFGFWPALILVSFASTSGATIAFLLSRFLLRDTINRRFGERLTKFNAALERDGPYYLFTLRLIPAVPFFVINVVMGLTPIRVWTFWWISQVGMLAGTAVYVFAGTRIPTANDLAEQGVGGILTWDFFLAFTLLGLFPLVVKKVMARFAPKSAQKEMTDSE